MTDLTSLTLSASLEGLRKKEFSSRELTLAYIAAMEKRRGLNAYVKETPELALSQADASDKKIKEGNPGLLEGAPVAVKDLFCTKGTATTACSRILEGFTPTYESTVTANMFRAGAVMLGKTNMDEFAMGSANLTSAYGNVKNPWGEKTGQELVPGGSSGGSASAVAANICAGALGSDTGGSIRQPAAFCGITGIKPTYGRCSRFGMVAFASSLDQAGPMTKTVKDAAIMLNAISGHDAKDSTSSALPVPDFAAAITGNIKGKRIGIPKEYQLPGLSQEISDLWKKGAEWLKAAGAEIVEISLPHAEHALPAYYIIAPAEASSNLARYDGVRYGLRVKGGGIDEMYGNTRAKGFGWEVKRRIMIGTYVLSAGYYDAYYKKAQRIRTLICRDFDQAFAKVDAILTPTTPTPAFEIGKKVTDPVEMYLNDVFTVTVNLANLPAISVPAGISDGGLPLGLQLIGKSFAEGEILNIASVVEQAAGFKRL